MIFAPSGGPKSYAGAEIYGSPGVPFPQYPQIKLSPPHPGLGRALRRFKPDVIHVVNPILQGLGGTYYAWRLGVPLVASYHTNIATYANYYKLSYMIGFTRYVTRTLHNRADINLCTSQTTLEYLLEEGIKRVRLWPQGVDYRRFRPDRGTEEWRAKLSGNHPADRLLLFVGRLAPEKGIEKLRVILEEIPGTRLAIVGDGPARGQLEQAFEGTRTVFTGLLEGGDLTAAYSSADAFLFPSTTETLGMAMIEALSSGLPVIAADSGATREVVDDGRSGLLYEAGSSEALVSVMERIVADEALREALGRGARAAAENRGWEAATRTLRGYYHEAGAAG